MHLPAVSRRSEPNQSWEKEPLHVMSGRVLSPLLVAEIVHAEAPPAHTTRPSDPILILILT